MEKTPGTADAAVVGKTHRPYRTRKSGRVEGKRDMGNGKQGGRHLLHQTIDKLIECVYFVCIFLCSHSLSSLVSVREIT